MDHCSFNFFILKAKVNRCATGHSLTHKIVDLLYIIIILILKVSEDFSEIVRTKKVTVLLGVFEIVRK